MQGVAVVSRNILCGVFDFSGIFDLNHPSIHLLSSQELDLKCRDEIFEESCTIIPMPFSVLGI